MGCGLRAGRDAMGRCVLGSAWGTKHQAAPRQQGSQSTDVNARANTGTCIDGVLLMGRRKEGVFQGQWRGSTKEGIETRPER